MISAYVPCTEPGAPSLTGAEIRHIMRVYKITIKEAAKAFDISQATVRKRRTEGVRGKVICMDWAIWLPRHIGKV